MAASLTSTTSTRTVRRSATSRGANGAGAAPPVANAMVASSVPGRMRVRIHRPHRHGDLMDQVESHLAARTGIHAVETNASTGSVVVEYDPDKHSSHDVLGLLNDLGLIIGDVAHSTGEEMPGVEVAQEVLASGTNAETVHAGPVGVVGPTDHSMAAATVVEAVDDLNARLHRFTGGIIDLRMVLPMAVGAVGLVQIARNGLQMAEVPGFVLLYYAFDSFHKFHRAHVVPMAQTLANTPGARTVQLGAGTEETIAPAPVLAGSARTAGATANGAARRRARPSRARSTTGSAAAATTETAAAASAP